MKKSHIYRILLLAVLFQFSAFFTSAQSVIAYMTIDGVRTGKFKGTSTVRGNEGKIDCIGFSYGVTSPRDPASGLPTGRRTHQPVRILKQMDSSSPQLLQAMYTNENLRTVTIEFYKREMDGRMGPSYTITLTNASISQISQNGGLLSTEKTANVNEEVSFTFQRIQFTDNIGRTVAGDDWNINR